MRHIKRSILPLLLLAALPAQADDLGRVVATARDKVWPGASHFAVICDYANSREAVESLAAQAKGYSLITVVDIRHNEQLGRAMGAIASRAPQFLVLLPNDPVVRDGSTGATFMIRALNTYQVPTIGTTRAALGQGAYFVQGADTNGEILSGPGVIFLQEARPTVDLARRGGPLIEVLHLPE